MLTLISPAKTFAKSRTKTKVSEPTTITAPLLQDKAESIVAASLSMPRPLLRKELSVSTKVFDEAIASLVQWYKNPTSDLRPAILAYAGMVFKKLGAERFDSKIWEYANRHLRMTSFVYGLLRPSDGIRPYRMEGSVVLPKIGQVFAYWRNILTDMLIEDIQSYGGVLCYLASQEMKSLFDWGRVVEHCSVIEPNFISIKSDGTEKQIVIYTKMARGTMVSNILRHQIDDVEALKQIQPEGFTFSSDSSTDTLWNYYRMTP